MLDYCITNDIMVGELGTLERKVLPRQGIYGEQRSGWFR